MSVRSASRGSPAAKSIRLALRTSSSVETRSASFVRLRCFGRRCLSSQPTLSAISLMPFIMWFQGPPGGEPLNHTPLPHVNSLSSKPIDGKATGRIPRFSVTHPHQHPFVYRSVKIQDAVHHILIAIQVDV